MARKTNPPKWRMLTVGVFKPQYITALYPDDMCIVHILTIYDSVCFGWTDLQRKTKLKEWHTKTLDKSAEEGK